MTTPDTLRFPIGSFEPVIAPSSQQREDWIGQIPELSGKLQSVLNHFQQEQLDVPYRPEGWTVRQIVHHLADNDMNAYIRFKRALTEQEPLASSYREDLWAELPDYMDLTIGNSVSLIELLHQRFYRLLLNLTPMDFRRTMRTEVLGTITLDTALQRFIWHHRHHTSQVAAFAARINRDQSTTIKPERTS
ncbi:MULTISPECIES: YfiT family bacillithiol transferase [unclassified Paenibacillus]|uniref:YfiT family bacillithiol transferase n=1 Tax=unclassified Paenibacillus TaxID=185978 RepID=UPI00119F59D0|nr:MULTISPECIES: putative metal-dependent hydrolase [unclassified Paenibacillus]MBJ9992784.1 putative metal-dependent hydrolase [Paenibacillus sp. S28]